MNEATLQVVEQVLQDHRLAYPQGVAAELIGISRSSLVREIRRKKITPTPTLRVIPREELVRYLREEVQLARRRKRFPRINNQTPPTTE